MPLWFRPGAGNCCQPILNGTPAATAEALMRARYSAHVLEAYDFLEESVHSSARKDVDTAKVRRWSDSVVWKGLEILSTEAGGPEDDHGRVSFVARFTINGIEQDMTEDAEFTREDGVWRYLDGQVHGHVTYRRESPKIGRNDPCPCGSGKKYKKCCGAA